MTALSSRAVEVWRNLWIQSLPRRNRGFCIRLRWLYPFHIRRRRASSARTQVGETTNRYVVSRSGTSPSLIVAVLGISNSPIMVKVHYAF
jgi:hypothetical protein